MDEDKLKEQLDKMIRDAVKDTLDRLGISVTVKDLPNVADIEKLLGKSSAQEKPDTNSKERKE